MNNPVAASEIDPGSSPRFQRAAIQSRLLATDAARVGLAAGLFLIGCWATGSFAPASIWPTFFGCNAVALGLLATGLQSASEVADWRRRKAGLQSLPAPVWLRWLRDLMMRPWDRPATDETSKQDRIERWGDGVSALAAAFFNRLGIRAVSLAALALLALFVGLSGLAWTAELPVLGRLGYGIAGACLLLAFGLLIIERGFAAVDAEEWPEAEAMMLLARLPIASLALSAFSLLLATTGYQWLVEIPPLLECLSILVALEFLIRAVIAMFSPRSDERQPPLLAESLVAGVLRWPPRPLTALQAELRGRHGIDLRQIWALAFIRRTFPIVAVAIAILGWFVTGVNEVPMMGRGIYERFGKPVAVVQPGLHLGLPWPFGRMLPVENGVVHELATSVSSDGNAPLTADAEGPAPDEANRLWDGTHVSETSQVIAGQSTGKQSFEIVNMDVRFVYRIGLSDQSAFDAAYRTADVPALMEATAGRVLVHDFAVRTLDDVLGEGRVDMANEIAAAVRADLDRLHSGIELLSVVVEAIHPPAGAANAYHAVQAAEISAQATVARERGLAAQSSNAAELAATVEQDKATATARESLAASDVARLQFEAEKTGFEKAGQVFLTEAYFSRLTSGLGHARALILDHRIGRQVAPTFDLRSMMTPIDPDLSGKAGPPAATREVNQ